MLYFIQITVRKLHAWQLTEITVGTKEISLIIQSQSTKGGTSARLQSLFPKGKKEEKYIVKQTGHLSQHLKPPGLRPEVAWLWQPHSG